MIDHFTMADTTQEAMVLFKSSITSIEIELFSFCNRVCWFCSNTLVDRRHPNQYLASTIYDGILQQLASIDYEGMISYSRYNEPLADRVILEKLAQARATVPHALLHTNTNGDYLNPEYLRELYRAGLRSLNIQLYLGNTEAYDHATMQDRAARMLSMLGLEATLATDEPGTWLEYRLQLQDMAIRLYARNFATTGCSRGNSLAINQNQVRTDPCFIPFQHMYIDYNGKVMPCCNLRSDLPMHQEHAVYDLSLQNDLFAAYAQSPLVDWRIRLANQLPKTGVCTSCLFPY